MKYLNLLASDSGIIEIHLKKDNMMITKDYRTFISFNNNDVKESFLVFKSNPKVITLQLKNAKNYKATLTLSSNEEIDLDVDSVFDIITSGKLYQLRITAYTKKNNSSVFYDDFDYIKCMPNVADVEVIRKLIEEIRSKSIALNS